MFNKNTEIDQTIDQSGTMQAGAGFTDNRALSANQSDKNNAQMSKSVIDELLVMKGDLESEGDILVKGKVLGNVRCQVLTVDKEAIIEGGIVAEEVFVHGTTTGKIRARRVNLHETAKVLSEIEHQIFAAQEGAHIEGTLKRIEGSIFKEQSDKKHVAEKSENERNPKSASASAGSQNSRGAGKTNGSSTR